MDQKYFQTLARYNRWANKKLYDVVETLSVEEFEKDSQAYFGSIQGTLNHILFGDWAWSLRLQDKNSSHLEMDKIYHPEFSKLKAARLEADEEFIRLIAGMNDEKIRSNVTYRNIKGIEYTTPRHLVLAHVFNHSTHHRGQVHCLLTQAGIEAPSLDLIYYNIDCTTAGVEA